MRTPLITSLAALLLLTGCASTTVKTTGHQLKEPLCQRGQTSIPTAIYWSTKWRADQKEPELREAAALRGIQDFVSSVGCLSEVTVHRLDAEQVTAPNGELQAQTNALNPRPERVLLIVVRELGPRLVIGLPVLVEGGTEVLVDVRVLDPKKSEPLAATNTLWRNGGPLVIKGVKTLALDMSAALKSTLMLEAGTK